MNAGELSDLLAARHSCRAFLPAQVPRLMIDRALEMAQRSPSSCNSQPWQAIITEGEATHRFREALHQHAASGNVPALSDADFAFPLTYGGVYKERQRACGWSLYRSVGIAPGDREASRKQVLRNFRLFDAPHVMILTTDRDLGVYGAIDCGSYMTIFMLAAQSLGLAAVAQAAIAGCSGFVRRYFDLPDDRRIVCGISFGFPDQEDAANGFRTTRAGRDEVVRYLS